MFYLDTTRKSWDATQVGTVGTSTYVLDCIETMFQLRESKHAIIFETDVLPRNPPS